ncbi:hypothetical protein GCM10023107_75810 [Actinoplanes octamycinicus]
MAAFQIRSRVCGWTRADLTRFSTTDTVETETPAAAATSLIPTFGMSPPVKYSTPGPKIVARLPAVGSMRRGHRYSTARPDATLTG